MAGMIREWVRGRSSNTLGIASVLVLSAFIAVALYASKGNVFAVAALLGVGLVVSVSMYRLEWGLYVFVGLVLVLDQFYIPGLNPITFQLEFFKNLKETSFFRGAGWGVLNPIEIYLLLLFFVWALLVSIRKRFRFVRIPVWGLCLAFFGWLVVSFGRGMSTGGEILPALWELRALFYLVIMYFFVPQIAHGKKQIESLMWVCILMITFKALQGAARFVSYGFSFAGFATLTNHEDPVFITTLIVFVCGLWLFGAKHRQRTFITVAMVVLVAGFAAGQRRAAYAGLFIGIAALVALLPRAQLMRLSKIALPLAPILILYIVVALNTNTKLGSPVRLLATSFSTEEEEAGDRYYSNLYRENEKYNLAVTLRSSPLMGIGFGKKYQTPIGLARIPFPLWNYIPHNEILWLLVKTGGLGFFLFWFFLNSYVFKGAYVLKNVRDPYLRAVGIISLVAVVNQLVVSYYDLQLTYYRNMIYLGILMALLPMIERADAESALERRTEDKP